jgi:hypothetical protein
LNELRDFTHAKNFPGTTGNSFDLILHRYARIEHVPWPLFGLGMAFFAWLVTGFRLERAAILYAYILVDWLLLALLPVANRSFGPPKPPLTILAIARAPFLWLPL